MPTPQRGSSLGASDPSATAAAFAPRSSAAAAAPRGSTASAAPRGSTGSAVRSATPGGQAAGAAAPRRARGQRNESQKKEKSKKKKKCKKAEEDGEEEELILRDKWVIREAHDLKMLVGGRRLTVKDFRLGRALGVGTFGVIRIVELRGFDGDDAVPFALKTMSKHKILNTNQLEHIQAEKRVMHTVDYPFIVHVLASFQDDRRLFFVLELAHGGDLFSRLKREGRLTVPHAKFYTAEIVLALGHLHSYNIAYRDLKPENVMIDWMGNIKLTDFGFAKALIWGDLTFTIVGTPEYLAPEILKSIGHNCVVDFWALGVLTFEMLAGYPPFMDASPFKVYEQILARDVKYPRHFDVKAVDLLEKLLTVPVEERLGNFGCMEHCWFDFIPWREMELQVVPAPWRPTLKNPFDTRYFERVPIEQARDGYDDTERITVRMDEHFHGKF